MKIINNIRKCYVIAKVSFSNILVYRTTLLSRFAFYTLFIYVFMSLWRAIYQQGSVHGYSFIQIVWYLIMTELISFSSGSTIYSKMNEDVKSGAIAYLIGRPIHYIFYQLSDLLGQIIFNFASFGILAAILGFVFVGPLYTFTLVSIPALILSVSVSVLLNYFFLMLIGLSAFVIEDNFALFLIYQKLAFMLGMFLPVEFLPEWLQPIAKSLPFSYVYWAPAKLFVDFSPELFLQLFPRQVMWMLVMGVLVMFTYSRCVKRLSVNGG